MSLWLRMLKKLCTYLRVIKGIGFLNKEDVEPSDMSDAVSSRLLIGPASCSLKSNPKYLDSLPASKSSKAINKSSSAKDLLIVPTVCASLCLLSRSRWPRYKTKTIKRKFCRYTRERAIVQKWSEVSLLSVSRVVVLYFEEVSKIRIRGVMENLSRGVLIRAVKEPKKSYRHLK